MGWQVSRPISTLVYPALCPGRSTPHPTSSPSGRQLGSKGRWKIPARDKDEGKGGPAFIPHSSLPGYSLGNDCVPLPSATDSGEPPLPHSHTVPGSSDTPSTLFAPFCPREGFWMLPISCSLDCLRPLSEPFRVRWRTPAKIPMWKLSK